MASDPVPAGERSLGAVPFLMLPETTVSIRLLDNTPATASPPAPKIAAGAEVALLVTVDRTWATELPMTSTLPPAAMRESMIWAIAPAGSLDA